MTLPPQGLKQAMKVFSFLLSALENFQYTHAENGLYREDILTLAVKYVTLNMKCSRIFEYANISV